MKLRRKATWRTAGKLRTAILHNRASTWAMLLGDCASCKRMAELALDTAGWTLQEFTSACMRQEDDVNAAT